MITPRAELSFSVPGSYSRRNSDLDVEDELSSYVRVSGPPSRRGSSSRALMQPSTAPCRSPVSMNLPSSCSVRTIDPTHRLASPLAESKLSHYERTRLSRAEFTPLREQILQPSVKNDSSEKSQISRHSLSISRDPRFIVSPADDSIALYGTGITVADMQEAQMLKSPMATRRALPTIQPSWSGSGSGPLLKTQASYSANPSGENPLSDDEDGRDTRPMRPEAAPNSLIGRSIVVRFSQGNTPRKSNSNSRRSRSVPRDRGPRSRHANMRKPSFSREEVPDALENRRSSLTAQLAAKQAQLLHGQRSRSAPPCKDRGGKQQRSRSAVKPFRVLESHDKILQLRVLLPEFTEGLVMEKLELKGPIAGEDLIARIIQTWNAKSNFIKSWKPLKSSRPVDYELRIVDEDDDEIDEDFPPLQRTKDVHSFNLQYIGMCFRRRRSVSVPEQRPSQTSIYEEMEASCQSPNTRRRRLISDSALCCFVTVDIPNVEVQHLHIDQRDTMYDVLDRINQRSTEQFYEHGHFEFYYRHDPAEALACDVTVHDLVTHDVLLLPRRDFSRHREHSLPRDHLLARRYEEFNISDLSDPSLARGPNTRTIGFNDQQILCCHQKVVSNATVLTPNFTYVWHRRGTSEERLKRKHRWIMTQTLRQQQARRWSVRRVETWIRTVQGGRFAYYADTCKHLQIDGRQLLELTESDLERTLRIEEPEDVEALFQYIQRLNPQVELDDTLTETFHTTPIQCLRSITQCPSIHDIFELEFELEGGARHTATYQAMSVTDCEKIVSRIASLLQLERAREMELSVMEEVRSEPCSGTSYRRGTAADPFSPPDDRRLQGAKWR